MTLNNHTQLPLVTKLAYGVGDLGTAITANLIAFFLLPFFTDVAGISPAWAGSILLVGKGWDAINDPIIGVLTDKTRTRWGRRRPWLLFGAIPFGLSFALLWWVPFPQQQDLLIIYYLIVAILFNTFYTAVNLPYVALTPELTDDYDQRTTLTNFRFAFSIGGSVISAVLHLSIVNLFQDNLMAGIFWAVVATIPVFICFWGTKERPIPTDQGEPMPILEQFKIAFSSKPYLFIIGIYICVWLAVQATATVIPYYITYWIRPENANQVISLTILAVQGTAFISLFAWNIISRKIGKKAVFVWGSSVWILAQIGLFVLQSQQILFMYILAVLAGAGVAVAYLVPWAMIPDVIDLDELVTGKRREGIFYGAMVLLQKFALAGALLGVGLALEMAGFIPPQGDKPVLDQPEAVLQVLRFLMAVVPMILLIIGIGLVSFYPITKEKHEETLALLAMGKHPSPNQD
jgi:GPH family glycoside/pentoside/hexuronide:cation symporter